MSKIDGTLFSGEGHANDHNLGNCPECGGELQFRRGKSGTFVGCKQFPKCEFSKPLHDNQTQDLTLIEGSVCPNCKEQLVIKKGRYGLFIGCSQYPVCHHIEPIQKNKNTEISCPSCKNGSLTKRSNKFGKTFYACNTFPKCKYAVNDAPVQKQCSYCGWGIVVEKHRNDSVVLQCPAKSCNKLQSN